MTNNPPNAVPAQVNYGIVSQLNSGVALAAVPSLRSFDVGGEVPTVYNYQFGLQYKLPFELVLDTSYVGSLSRHLQAQINLNAIPYGTTFLPQNAGITNRDFLRPYMGFGDITYYKADATSNYNSLQVSLNRRMASRLFFGLAYTWSKALTTASGDGDFQRIDTNNRKANYGLADFHRAHTLAVNWVYEIPGPVGNEVLRHTLGGWQLSGIYQYQTGQPDNISFSIPGITNELLTGSFTEGARLRLIGDPTAVSNRDEYHGSILLPSCRRRRGAPRTHLPRSAWKRRIGTSSGRGSTTGRCLCRRRSASRNGRASSSVLMRSMRSITRNSVMSDARPTSRICKAPPRAICRRSMPRAASG
jgi:hypothetical protein